VFLRNHSPIEDLMLTHLSMTTKATIFYTLTLALAFVVTFLPGASTDLYMLTPATAVLLMLLIVTRDGYHRRGWAILGLHRAGWRTWGLAVFVPLLVMGAAYATVWGMGWGTFIVPDQLFGFAVPLWLVPALALFLIATNSLTVSLGEELGWRGYLLPNLASLGVWRAAMISGFLWGVWHLPFMLLTDQYHADQNMWITVPLFLVATTTAGLFLAYLRLRTDSVWPASIAHSAHNTFWALGAAFTAGSPLSEYLAGDAGILLSVGYAVIGSILLSRLSRRAASKGSLSTLEPTQAAQG
jgi:membrane protease YdiL (CAAX protease family)